MKLAIAFLIIFTQTIIYSQWECNTGITTGLNSSSDGWPGTYLWKGWACGANGTVIRVDNAPYSPWVNVSGNGIPSNVVLDNICGMDGAVALVCGHLNGNTWMWKTVNSGANWTQVFTQPNGMFNAVYMKNYQKGFLAGNPVNGRWSLWKTSNGGINWDSTGLYLTQSGNEQGLANSLCIGSGIDSNKIWFGTNNNRIYYSSNYGQSWSAQTFITEQNIYSISYGFVNPNMTLFAGGTSSIYRSTNYGNNWLKDTIGGSGNITGIAFLTWRVIATRGSKVYGLSFGGNLWGLTYNAPNGTYNFMNSKEGGRNWTLAFAVRDNGGITFFTEGEGIKSISNNIPSAFSLSQNYPNPFNPSTKINFSIPLLRAVDAEGGRSALTQLKIYNILGEEVTSLVNESLQPGTYEVTWDASNQSSGTYFYKLISSDYSETKKMILMK